MARYEPAGRVRFRMFRDLIPSPRRRSSSSTLQREGEVTKGDGIVLAKLGYRLVGKTLHLVKSCSRPLAYRKSLHGGE